MPTEQKTIRKLRAILSADVKGYSLLMADNELATIATLKSYRQKMTFLIQQHQGRVVDSPGDNILAEFASAVDAVKCAVKIQEELKERNAELSEDRKMQFRIGINIGDVVQDADRIYGDGVNVAARIEGLAEPGGICISRGVCDHVKKKLKLGFEYLGEHAVKNISEPVRVYKVLTSPEEVGRIIGEKKAIPKQRRKFFFAASVMVILGIAAAILWDLYFRPPPIEVASVEKMAYPLPNKPSIAVLPFVNMSGDSEQDYFSDGITEQIITALSKSPDLFVISRSSTFTYKGKPVKVQQVSQDLGVRYVLEGSVQKAGNQVRITAQLIDAKGGQHLWAERYDRDLKDIFALQDEITIKIMSSLRVKLLESREAEVQFFSRTNNLESYLKYMKAEYYQGRGTPAGWVLARKLAEEAIALDPEYPAPYILLSWSHIMEAYKPKNKSPRESLDKAFELAQKMLAMDESNPGGHMMLGEVYTVLGENEKAIAEFERGLALDPNNAYGYMILGNTLTTEGRSQEAIPLLQKSMRLSPLSQTHASMCLYRLGRAYRNMGQYDQALSALKKALDIRPNFFLIHMERAATYIHLGREEEARAAAAEVRRTNTRFSLEVMARFWAYKNPNDQERYVEALRQAGLK